MFVIEGDPRAVHVARAMTRTLGGLPMKLSAGNKPLYHAAAVIAASHVLALEETSIRIFASLGVKRREALKALLPLTRQVLENFERLGPRAAWTGPLARRDYGVAVNDDFSVDESATAKLRAQAAE